ncbi:MAG: G5 domain-containing protein [Rudaea sp.]
MRDLTRAPLWSAIVALFALMLLAACQTEKRVIILVDGQRRVVETQAATVAEVLQSERIRLGDDDRVDPPGYTPIDRTATIRITRVESVTEEKREPVEFSREVTRDESLPEGEMRVIQLGANGEQEITYRVTREDGREISRREIGRVQLQEPRKEILVLGTQNSVAPVAIRGALVYLAHGNAWVMRDSSGARRPLTFSGDLDGRVFDLSPNGRYLLFTRANENHLNTLWVADTLVVGDKPRPVPLQDLLYAQWAPDGSPQIAFSTGEKTAGAPGWKAHGDLAVATLGGPTAALPVTTTVTTGTKAGRPAFTQAAVSLTVTADIPITLTTRTLIPSGIPAVFGWWGSSLAWSPDASTFAFAFADRVGWIDAVTGERVTGRSFPYYNTRAEWVWVPQLAWSPDGRFVITTLHGASEGAGTPQDSPAFDDWVLARDGSLALMLGPAAGMWSAPSWSPADGQGESRIAYGVSLNSADTERSAYALYVMNRDGSGRKKILPRGSENGLKFVQVAWAPDASQLVAVRDGDLWLYDFAQDRWSPLTANGDTHWPRWK